MDILYTLMDTEHKAALFDEIVEHFLNNEEWDEEFAGFILSIFVREGIWEYGKRSVDFKDKWEFMKNV